MNPELRTRPLNPARVVIVGGGFGGLNAARALAGADVRVTLLDRHNYHLFQPLLYQVAAASLSPGDVASPIRWILRHQANIEVLLANVRRIDPGARQVIVDGGDPIAYARWQRGHPAQGRRPTPSRNICASWKPSLRLL